VFGFKEGEVIFAHPTPGLHELKTTPCKLRLTLFKGDVVAVKGHMVNPLAVTEEELCKNGGARDWLYEFPNHGAYSGFQLGDVQ